VLQCVAMRCNALQCVVVCCSVLQCVALLRSNESVSLLIQVADASAYAFSPKDLVNIYMCVCDTHIYIHRYTYMHSHPRIW